MDILYQDKRIVVAVKPAGVLSTDEPGGMPALLRQELGTECFRTVHRLDAQVSGLMVYARSQKAAALLSEEIRNGQFQKEYLAVVHGIPPKSGTFIDLLGRDNIRRITYVAHTPGKEVRQAKLDYEVLETVHERSLVRIRLHTGRTHQIRVQFQSRGFPLCGDRKYGTEDGISPIALYSHRLTFLHPETGEPLQFCQIPPLDGIWDPFYSIRERGVLL